ncbi:hypothetical protein HO173_000602 [Letharia columbiana]|uniref:GH26 domain-containing protein n=1 Tax=Letharia columbiana TaxID=112416 RepID=A0A8H6G7Y4_9LECA|nr:uncharacterized protein HO173_000602 [Letharia columbiana]KAF6241890.1 hypothetical protein HO173_000602 [Letharia columbiana]
MHLQLVSTIVALAQLASCAPFLEGRDTCTTNDLNFPSGGMHGYNGIYWGFLPDDVAGTTMSHINGDSGKKASTYGRYSQISSVPYTGDQLTSVMSDVVASGAVFIPAIMPTGLKFADISTDVANQIASVLEKFTSQGVEVWLRFAHEVNYYVTQASGPTYPGGTQAEFIAAWQRVHAAVASNPKILMFWSPNEDSVANLNGWWPGADYVDIVGMDVYPNPGATFASAYGAFYDGFAQQYNKHFCIGETGAANGGSVADKEAWVARLAKGDVSAYPCYKSATWFEFYKGVDFRIVEGQSATTVTETLSNFA